MVNKAAYEKLVNEDCKKYHLDKVCYRFWGKNVLLSIFVIHY